MFRRAFASQTPVTYGIDPRRCDSSTRAEDCTVLFLHLPSTGGYEGARENTGVCEIKTTQTNLPSVFGGNPVSPISMLPCSAPSSRKTQSLFRTTLHLYKHARQHLNRGRGADATVKFVRTAFILQTPVSVSVHQYISININISISNYPYQ